MLLPKQELITSNKHCIKAYIPSTFFKNEKVNYRISINAWWKDDIVFNQKE